MTSPDDRDSAGPHPQTEMETAQEHSGSSDVSHGMNTNLTPDGAATPADENAAQVIQEQKQGSEQPSGDEDS